MAQISIALRKTIGVTDVSTASAVVVFSDSEEVLSLYIYGCTFLQ